MKKLILIITLCLAVSGTAQNTNYSVFSYTYFIPKVTLNDNTASLQQSIYPQLYKNRSVNGDIQWVKENNSLLAEYWSLQGDTILHILTEMSGIEWIEPQFDIYAVRYFPTIGSAQPLIIPIGGINDNVKIEAVPDFDKQRLLLIYQLSKRMLKQVYEPQETNLYTITNHPLMRETPYRFDNLAMLLALNTAYSVLGVDTTADIYNSRFWKNKFPGRKIFEEYFENSWILSPDKPLAEWIADEPSFSKLVSATRPPRKINQDDNREKKYVEDIPLKGMFGFTVKHNSAYQLVVTKIDMYRLGYACGLREDDIIKRADGKIVKNQKSLVEALLAKIDEGGAVLEIVRNSEALDIIIQPLDINYLSDEYYFDEYNQSDSVYFDTLPPDTSGY
ncbi:MAG: hypothetical protein DWP97_07890 [Calditrichaeota bacterium]|nr:MAG: hypothetical protein DWP97_07890 [Calditrichota bacterium]